MELCHSIDPGFLADSSAVCEQILGSLAARLEGGLWFPLGVFGFRWKCGADAEHRGGRAEVGRESRGGQGGGCSGEPAQGLAT